MKQNKLNFAILGLLLFISTNSLYSQYVDTIKYEKELYDILKTSNNFNRITYYCSDMAIDCGCIHLPLSLLSDSLLTRHLCYYCRKYEKYDKVLSSGYFLDFIFNIKTKEVVVFDRAFMEKYSWEEWNLLELNVPR